MQIKSLYEHLLAKHGPQGWWPTRNMGYHPSNKSRKLSEDEMLEICVGAILTQNTAWKNVEKALDNLFSARAMSLRRLASMPRARLAQLIRSSGYYNQKAERLQLFARHVLKEHRSFSRMFKQDLEPLREELLSLKGIGPETADSMLLYAGRKPIFVIDAYTKRICAREGICKPDVEYHELQEKFHKQLPPNHKLYNEFHALFVEEGKKKQ
ncbi:MAG: endonuclease III domain-containing protein [Candidatus Woesearchaeota archaeon]